MSTDHGTDSTSRRWYDPNRVSLVLFGVVSAAILAWGGYVFAKSTNAADKNIEQDQRIKALEDVTTKIDAKLDKVLDRLPPK